MITIWKLGGDYWGRGGENLANEPSSDEPPMSDGCDLLQRMNTKIKNPKGLHVNLGYCLHAFDLISS